MVATASSALLPSSLALAASRRRWSSFRRSRRLCLPKTLHEARNAGSRPLNRPYSIATLEPRKGLGMIPRWGVRHVLLRLLFVNRQRLELENVALRHQLAALERWVKRSWIRDSDRMIWILMLRMLREWREAVYFVTPDGSL